MDVQFTPIRSDAELAVEVQGDTLVINGECFDFSVIPEGAILPRDAMASDWFASDVRRIGGIIHLTLLLPHPAEAEPDRRFPPRLSASAGRIVLPGDTTHSEESQK